MASDPSIRASDRERDRTARLLSEHHAAGRLDGDEFAERLDRVYAAKTVDDLDALTADLPAIDLYPLPSASLPRHRVASSGLPSASVFSGSGGPGGPGGSGRLWSGRVPAGPAVLWGSWSAVMAVCLTLWLISGNPWPLLWAAAVGVAIGGQRVTRRALGHGEALRAGQPRARPELGEPPQEPAEDRDREG
jgi:hypothetical protein